MMKSLLLAMTFLSLSPVMAFTDQADRDLEALLAEAREAELGFSDEAEAADYFSSLSSSPDELLSDEGELDDLLRDAY